MALQPWIPEALKKYSKARKVLGVMATGEPTADQYQRLHREKVITLIRKAENLEPIETHLNLPLHYLNNPKDPEAVYQDLEDLAPEWRSPVHFLVMHLKGKEPMREVKERLELEQADLQTPVRKFRRELYELTLEEFLDLAPGPPSIRT